MSNLLRSKWTATAVFVCGLTGCLFLAPGTRVTTLPLLIGIWSAVVLAAESLWHPSFDESTPVSVAPAAHLAALAALPPVWGLPLVAASSFFGSVLWRRTGIPGALRCLLCTSVSSLGALIVVHATGIRDQTRILDGVTRFQAPENLLYFFLAGIVYLALFQVLSSIKISRRRGIAAWDQWRSVYGHETELISSGALILVATLAFFCYQTLGFRGLLLCAMPLLFVKDGSRRNIELKRAQSRLIKNERLAAKGEMAAEIGHELNNYLAAISGRAQLLLRGLSGDADTALRNEANATRDLAHRMGELAKGLMEFSRREGRRTSSGLNDLVKKTVDFVRPQSKYRIWEFALSPDPQVPRVEIDPGQIQQVLLILLGRLTAGEAPRPAARCGLEIRTFRDETANAAGIEISSTRPGTPRPAAPEGVDEDEDLITVRRILERHHGRFERSELPEGESYRVLLPAA
jgi:signal transduction histidine kinase